MKNSAVLKVFKDNRDYLAEQIVTKKEYYRTETSALLIRGYKIHFSPDGKSVSCPCQDYNRGNHCKHLRAYEILTGRKIK